MPRIAWLEPAPAAPARYAPTTEGARRRFAEGLTTFRDPMEPGGAFCAARAATAVRVLPDVRR